MVCKVLKRKKGSRGKGVVVSRLVLEQSIAGGFNTYKRGNDGATCWLGVDTIFPLPTP
jgi:hypothetical protein